MPIVWVNLSFGQGSMYGGIFLSRHGPDRDLQISEVTNCVQVPNLQGAIARRLLYCELIVQACCPRSRLPATPHTLVTSVQVKFAASQPRKSRNCATVTFLKARPRVRSLQQVLSDTDSGAYFMDCTRHRSPLFKLIRPWGYQRTRGV